MAKSAEELKAEADAKVKADADKKKEAAEANSDAAKARDKAAADARKRQADAQARKDKAAGVDGKANQSEDAKRIAESREALKHELPPGMSFFEAPDGLVVLGESERPDMPERRQGKAWKTINPMRGASRRA